jgi:two-component system, chemotaxis family, chemotaxis protein CheY
MKIKILIIEDELVLQDAYKHILVHMGYEVAVASNGIEGIEKLDTFKPHLILLDVLMPRLDGVGFLQQSDLRQKHPHIKVIACTNLSDQMTADQMLAYGANRQVLKSDLSPSQLAALVKELLDE